MGKPNPNGANQYVFDPRQKMCWELYIDPKSKTFGNATQSAIKAGYKHSSADRITTEAWFSGKLRKLNLVSKAERNLNEFLDLDDKDPAIKRIKLDATKFVASTLGKNEGFSTRTEVTGKDGKELPTPILAYGIPTNDSNSKDPKAEQED